MPALSVNIITKDQVEATTRAIRSLRFLLQEGDEVVVVDTGSSHENFAALKESLKKIQKDWALNVIDARHLSVPLRPYIEKWLPDRLGQIEEDAQYANYKGILNFAEARNVALENSKNPLIFWLDTDDIFEENPPGALRDLIERHMGDEPKYSALFLDYKYAFADDGNCTTILKRERVFLREHYEWKGRCHETAIMKGPGLPPIGYCSDLNAAIVHTEARKPHHISDIRNYIILKRELDELPDKEQADPRTLFYLGNACRGMSRHQEAIALYKKFDGLSGSVDDRFSSAYYVAAIYMHQDVRRPVDAMDWYFKCIELKPSDPRGYFGLSRSYMAQMRYDVALEWYDAGCRYPEPAQSLHSYDPQHIQHEPHLIAAEACRELRQHDRAIECAKRAYAARPNDEKTQKYCQGMENWYAGSRLADALEYVGAHVRGGGPNARRVLRKILDELHAVPPSLEDAGISRKEPPDPRPKRPKIAFYCGPTGEPWGPKSRETGIGGSEKMVLLLAPALQKRGYNVTVYCDCPFDQRGVYETDGVRWQHYAEIDFDIPRHALIVWRSHSNILLPLTVTGKRILWLHDVQNPVIYTREILETVDLVQVQSQFHEDTLQGVVPAEKIWRARNAVKLVTPDVERDPKRVIFFSSPDRGATTAMEIVLRAQKLDPEIKATILYGFSPFERKHRSHSNHRAIPDLGRDASMDDYERYFGALVDVTHADFHRRVSFDQVDEEVAKAGMWLYPTRFPEISCMAAMEAQVHGCIPLYSGFAALKETVLIPGKEFGADLGVPPTPATEDYLARAAMAVVEKAKIAADDPARTLIADAARKAFDVEPLADEWAAKIG